MAECPRLARPVTRIALSAGIVAAGALLLLARSPEAMLAKSYERSLSGADVSWSAQHRGNIWLSSVPAGGGLKAGLAVGDRITIAKRGGGSQEIEVTGLEPVDGAGAATGGMQYQVVTGRAVSSGTAVRFIFAVDAEAQPAAPALPAAPVRGRTL